MGTSHHPEQIGADGVPGDELHILAEVGGKAGERVATTFMWARAASSATKNDFEDGHGWHQEAYHRARRRSVVG